MLAQAVRRAVPLTISEQGEVIRENLPAVLLSASSERAPAADAEVVPERIEAFGRATLRAMYAALEARGPRAVRVERRHRRPGSPAAQPGPSGCSCWHSCCPCSQRRSTGCSVRVAVGWRWATGSCGRHCGPPPLPPPGCGPGFSASSGAVTALPAPAAAGGPPLDGSGWTALVTTALIGAGVAFVVGRRAPRGPRLATGAAATAVGILLSGLVLGVWLLNPYAAALLLPAAHAWLLATASQRGPRRVIGLAAVTVGLTLPWSWSSTTSTPGASIRSTVCGRASAWWPAERSVPPPP